MSLENTIQEYKQVEQKAHIYDQSAIVNKSTQELLELDQGVRKKDYANITEETSDLIANMLSAVYTYSIVPNEDNVKPTIVSRDEVFDQYAEWNEDVQGYGQHYSRRKVSREKLQDSTEKSLSYILGFGDSSLTLQGILKRNTEKFKSRIDKYRPQINIDDYVDDIRFKGVPFKDIKKLLLNPNVMKFVCRELAMKCKNADVIAGFDARGFIFASVVAQMLNKPLVMIRKPDKLPGEVLEVEYTLEYEENIPHYLQMQVGGIQPGQSVALIDDVLATGGTMKGGAKLIEGLQGKVDVMAAVLGLDYCHRHNEIPSYNVKAIRSYSEPANI